MKQKLCCIALSIIAASPTLASAQTFEKISRDQFIEFATTQEVETAKFHLTDPGKASPATLNASKDGNNWQVIFYWCDDKEAASGCLDFQFRQELKGEWPQEFVHDWNSNRRFGRVYRTEDGVGLVADINVEGGVTTKYLEVMTRVWFEMTGLVPKEEKNYIAPD